MTTPLETDPAPPRPQGPRRLVIGLVAVAAALVLVVVGVIAFHGDDEKPTGTNTSKTAFALPALHGSGTVRLADFRGRPTVVNLFASWCSVCDLELPNFTKASKTLKGKVNFVGVDSMETGDPDLMPSRHHLEGWALAKDVGGSPGRGFHDALSVDAGMPITAFYDANGKLLRVQTGGLLEDDFKSVFEQVYKITL
jgi:thiol-disulfide isomerase/thioredoxin